MTGMMLPEVASRLFDTPLMLDAGKAAAILAVVGGRVAGVEVLLEGADPVRHIAFEGGRLTAGRLSDRLGRAYDRADRSTYDIVDGVAVIPIEGTLVHKGAYVGMSSGRTSYQGLQAQVSRAARDPKVRGIAFEVDSFGGEVAGAFETADLIHAVGRVKPTISILTDHALSAGYLLASAARQVVMPEHGRAGSIGVITLHADHSAQLEKEGVKVTVLHAGKLKAEGHPFAPLAEDTAGRIRSGLEAARQTFATAVGRYRGKRFTSAQALDTEAADFRGSEAVSLGLADATGHALDAFGAFVEAVNSRGRGSAV